ncbi:S41 family peptidase [Microbulbifer sp. CnH-101-E]|uniref:S41 family peptidase n=1 Tax=unclassified Microbulbifer TaxID=2619833 RepID=UPI00403A6AAA
MKLIAAFSLALCHTISSATYASDNDEDCRFNPTVVIQSAASAIAETYVLADKAQSVSLALSEMASSPEALRLCRDSENFAKLITEKIRTLSGDKHFYLEPVSPNEDSNNWIAQWRAEAPKNNYGVKKLELLPGNIAYFKLSSFHTFENARQSLAAAFTLLQHSDGLILDLRNNGGGDSDTATAILESFVDPTNPLPYVIETREKQHSPERIKELPWPAYGTQRPMVVLINGRSFSASESIAFSLQQLGRATIIGSASAGGAHMMDAPQTLPFSFEIGIPSSRPVSTLSKELVNWEGQGVRPNIESSEQEILQVALKVLKK